MSLFSFKKPSFLAPVNKILGMENEDGIINGFITNFSVSIHIFTLLYRHRFCLFFRYS